LNKLIFLIQYSL